jgi:hypothetical protein
MKWPPRVTVHKGIYFASIGGIVPTAATLETLAAAPLPTYSHVSKIIAQRCEACRTFGSTCYIPPIHWEMHMDGDYVVELTASTINSLLNGIPLHPLTHRALRAAKSGTTRLMAMTYAPSYTFSGGEGKHGQRAYTFMPLQEFPVTHARYYTQPHYHL